MSTELLVFQEAVGGLRTSNFWQISLIDKSNPQSAGFEPARAEPNGFLVHRLNHSATTACYILGNNLL